MIRIGVNGEERVLDIDPHYQLRRRVAVLVSRAHRVSHRRW
ncbi:MAG: hypothetical protein ACI87W_003622 [Halieaceae bacterium]|jgi:hypothetical protein